jgi:sulfite exporter TauE/SafE
MIGSLLALGLLLGLKHAVEADHLSTVATLASRSSSARQTVAVATAWGLGHASSLMVLGTLLVALGATLPPPVAHAFELAIGLILIALGVGVLLRLRESRIHLHVHEHAGTRHLHAHAHEEKSAADRHDHLHRSPLWRRSLLIGGVHGLAGSAAVTVLALPAGSIGRALVYLLVFGAGTVLGMVALTLVVSLPLKFSFQRNRWIWIALQCSLSIIDISLGAWIVVQSSPL